MPVAISWRGQKLETPCECCMILTTNLIASKNTVYNKFIHSTNKDKKEREKQKQNMSQLALPKYVVV